MEYVEKHDQIYPDYNMSPPQKLQFLYKSVNKESKSLYIDRVKSFATQFDQAEKWSMRSTTSKYGRRVLRNS